MPTGALPTPGPGAPGAVFPPSEFGVAQPPFSFPYPDAVASAGAPTAPADPLTGSFAFPMPDAGMGTPPAGTPMPQAGPGTPPNGTLPPEGVPAAPAPGFPAPELVGAAAMTGFPAPAAATMAGPMPGMTGAMPGLAEPASALAAGMPGATAPAQAMAAAPMAPPMPAPVPAPAPMAPQMAPPAAPAPVFAAAPFPAAPLVPPAAPMPTPAPMPAAPAGPTFAGTGTAYLGKADKALAFARAQIGRPCLPGATGPESYDCSSLTQAAWRAAGVTLPRAAIDQAKDFTRVGLDALRPGDLVFFHDDLSHVGLCTDGGMMIHAPGPGATIREEPITAVGEGTVRGAVRPA